MHFFGGRGRSPLKDCYRKFSTIYALASAKGKAGVGIIRISGPQTRGILSSLVSKPTEIFDNPRRLYNRIVKDDKGNAIDQAMVVFFKSPHSFTGEDVCELHIHSSAAIISSIYHRLSSFPQTRISEPGEFTRRSFINGKFDMTQIEGLADIIASETEGQRRLAISQMEGTISRQFEKWRTEIIKAMAMVEAWIDFSEDEQIEEGTLLQVSGIIDKLMEDIKIQLERSKFSEILKSGFQVTLCGNPNAGKSSILNRLAQREIAIVSHIAGTTRDVLQVNMNVNGIQTIISDTAGIRDMATIDDVEKEGIDRALKTAARSDLVLFVVDASTAMSDLSWINTLSTFNPEKTEIILNKVDLISYPLNLIPFLPVPFKQVGIIENSCYDDACKIESKFPSIIKSRCPDLDDNSNLPTIVNERHCQLARSALENLRLFRNSPSEELVIAAEYLRIALNCIGKVTGHVDSEKVLDVLFSSFCIGK